MQVFKTVFTALVTAAITIGLYSFYSQDNQKTNSNNIEAETVYERVMRTGVLRCGYWNWPPLTGKDQKTGEMTGIFYEYTNKLGEILGLEVEWTKDTGFSEFPLDLKFDRIDAMCAGVWPVAPRPRIMAFTDPLFYVPLNIYVRADDTRFDYNDSKLNDPQFTFASMDGLVENTIIRNRYPKADKIVLTEINTVPELFTNVVSGKADATVNDVFTAYNFMSNNPGTMRKVELKRPLMYFGNTIAMKKGETELRHMLNVATQELHQSGFIDKLISKYENTPGAILRIQTPYRKND